LKTPELLPEGGEDPPNRIERNFEGAKNSAAKIARLFSPARFL